MTALRSFLAVSFITAAATAGAGPGPTPPEALARASGCYLCHNLGAAAGGKTPKPLAPSWRHIADRYASQPHAEQRLVKVVLDGSGRSLSDRNWSTQVVLGEMPPHRGQLTVGEVQRIVRWILAI